VSQHYEKILAPCGPQRNGFAKLALSFLYGDGFPGRSGWEGSKPVINTHRETIRDFVPLRFETPDGYIVALENFQAEASSCSQLLHSHR